MRIEKKSGQKKVVDVAVIGAGTAGLNARRAAQKAGASTVLIDPGPLGTTCARVGCMPSKLLIAAAETAHHISHASLFGIEGTARVKGRRVMERVRSERDRFVASVMPSYERLEDKKLLIREKAVFVAPGILQAGETRVEARSVVIAAGVQSVIPEPYQPYQDLILTNEAIFEIPEIPESLLVVGSGVIGLELGQAFHRLGAKVTILGRGGRAGIFHEGEMALKAAKIFSKELDLETHHELLGLERAESGLRVKFKGASGVREETYSRVLIAAGRKPSLESLGLEKAGIQLDEKGRLSVNPETMQVGDKAVFLAGDISGVRPLLHEAGEEGRMAGENAARYPKVKSFQRKTFLSIVFSDPQMAKVGTAGDKTDSNLEVMGEVDYGKQGRSQVMGQNQGWVKIYAEKKSGKLKGAEMLGPRMEHLSHLLCWAIEQGLNVEQILQMPVYHPTFEEGLFTALEDLQKKL